jgi:hypothetical protein
LDFAPAGVLLLTYRFSRKRAISAVSYGLCEQHCGVIGASIASIGRATGLINGLLFLPSERYWY